MSITDIQSNRTNFGINKLRDMSYNPKPYIFECMATMNGQFLVLEDYVYDVFNKIKLGDIKANNFQLFFEIANIQRKFLSKKGLTEGVEHIDRHLNLLNEGLEKHGDMLLELERRGYNVLLAENQILNEGLFDDVGNFINKNIVQPIKKGGKAVIKAVTNTKVYKYTAKKADELFTWIKTKGVALLGKGAMWVMRNLERALFSVVGITVDIILALTGVGGLAMAIIWGIVTVYRCILFAQDPSWWNVIMIILCAIGMIPFGAAVAKGMRVAASGFKGVKSSAGAAKQLKKVFSPKQINFIGKVVGGAAKLPLKLGKSLAWLLNKFPGMKGKFSGVMKWFDKAIFKVNKVFAGAPKVSSTVVGVIGGGFIAGEYYYQTKGTTYFDPFGLAKNDIPVYADYKFNPMTGVDEPVGKEIGKIREGDDYKITIKGDTEEFVPFSSSPYYDSMLKQRLFTGEVWKKTDEKNEEGNNLFELYKCSKLGCPMGYETDPKTGLAVMIKQNLDYDVPPIADEGGEEGEVEYVPFTGESEEEYQDWLRSQGFLDESHIIQYINKQYI